MRIAAKIDDIPNTPFRVLAEEVNWFLNEKSPASADTFHEVFVQFITEDGNLSTIVTDDITLEIP